MESKCIFYLSEAFIETGKYIYIEFFISHLYFNKRDNFLFCFCFVSWLKWVFL